jgi:hypothetical protein
MGCVVKELKKLEDGRHFAYVGYTKPGSNQQHKFMLGRDENAAVQRVALIRSLWKHSSNLARKMGEPVIWDEIGLSIAKEVAAGETTISVEIDAGDLADTAVGVLADWQAVVPGVRLRMRDQAAEQDGSRLRRQEAEKLISMGRELLETGGSHTLHEAVRAYVASIRKNPLYLISDGSRLTDWGKVKIDQIEFCTDHMPDVRLTELNKLAKITSLLNIIAARPCKKSTRGKPTQTPIRKSYASAVIKEFRVFLNWLHDAEEFHWEKPRDYAVKPVKVKHDVAKNGPVRVATYKLPELVTLWRYATPWERCLMTLALATGFGQAEVATLRRDEILLNTQHPDADELHLDTAHNDSWIRRVRPKTNVYAEWWLMPAAVQAVEWLTGHRPASSEPYLVLTKRGKPLKVEGQRNTQIANAWGRLLRRVRKDHKEFRLLSFNKLRKTSANWIRQNVNRDRDAEDRKQSDGDYLADLFLSHGEPVAGDLNAYTNERWADLHAAIRRLADWLEPVFGSVPDPFPTQEKKGGANISPGMIRRIIDLHEAGDRIALIAEKVNVSRETVRRWIKRHQAEGAKTPQAKTG